METDNPDGDGPQTKGQYRFLVLLLGLGKLLGSVRDFFNRIFKRQN